MNCDELARRVDDYLDGELDAPTSEALHAHLDTCADCRAQFGPLLEAVADLGELPELRAPAGLIEGVMVRLPERSVRREALPAGPVWALGIAGAAATALIAVATLWLAQGIALSWGELARGLALGAQSLAESLGVALNVAGVVATTAGEPLAMALLVNVALLGAAAIVMLGRLRWAPSTAQVIA